MSRSIPWAALVSASGAVALAWRGAAELRVRRMLKMVGRPVRPHDPGPRGGADRARPRMGPHTVLAPAALLAVAGGLLGWTVAGPLGAALGASVGGGGPVARRRRRDRHRVEVLEAQLAEVAEGMSLALRSGLSVLQALDFCRAESLPPLRHILERFADERRLGVPFETALEHLGESLGTDDARLFVLVTGIHARSGGDLAGALDEVARTIRHRVAVRRELRAASAQGRISGAIMGALPIAFFLFLSVSSHDRLSPVLRSPAGMAMVGAGLAMEGLAYVWIRHLLVIES